MGTVSELWVYPVKSCGGVLLKRAELVPGGLRGDRRFMLVDENGGFLSGRSEPRLLSVETELCGESPGEDGYILRAPGKQPLALPFALESGEQQRVQARVWRDEVRALEWEPGSAWFRDYLGRPDVRLLYQPEDALRQVDPKRARVGDVVSFADGYPLLLCSEESLAALNERLEAPVPMTRFRPNVVIKGFEPFAEDRWEELSLGQTPFEAPKLCDRCVMTTVDPKIGKASKEPLRTLARFRRWKGAVWFGCNIIPRAPGILSLDARVQVQSLRTHPRDTTDD